VFTEREIEMLHLKEYFDDIVYSSDERVKKPDVRFYNVMIRRHHLNPATTVMVGNDGLCDIEGALVAGMQAIHVHSNIEGCKPCPKEIKSIPVESMDLLKNELLKEELK
jgi:putative hydrolase of the HAD superfamily